VIPFIDGLSRRSRRRILVVLMSGFLGLGVPIWVPRVLATLPAFRVAEVRVLGTRYVPPDEIERLAGFGPDASVWDDPAAWESRIRAHPMVLDASVRRHGLGALDIVVVERRPVALVATPELVPVNGDGRVLPLDGPEARLDLPIIAGITEVEGDRVVDPGVQELALVMGRLARANAEFASVISEVAFAAKGGYRFSMLRGAEVGVVFLPLEDPVGALDRVSVALGLMSDPRVARADARFTGQVVVTRAEGR